MLAFYIARRQIPMLLLMTMLDPVYQRHGHLPPVPPFKGMHIQSGTGTNRTESTIHTKQYIVQRCTLRRKCKG